MSEEKAISFDWLRFIEKVQKHLPKVSKDGTGNFGSYMKLEDLNPALLKLLNENDFSWVTLPSTVDGKPALKYMLVDCQSGVSVEDSMLLSMDKNSPQGQGSAITYARRYSLAAVTGIVSDMDDDGAEATKLSSTDKTLEDLEDIISLAPTKEDLRKLFAGLTPSEKKMALPLIQAKISEIEVA